MKKLLWLSALLSLTFTLPACDDGDETPPNYDTSGRVDLTIWGEDYADEGIPAEDVSDGWAIHFEHVLLHVSEASLDGNGNPTLLHTPRIIDLASGGAGPKQLDTGDVASGTYATMQYRISPVSADYNTEELTHTAHAMVDAQDSVVVIGEATKDGRTVGFHWTFNTDTRYEQCQIDMTVGETETHAVEATIHLDHLFFDDLDSSTPRIAFDLIASAADDDDFVGNEQLRAVDITATDYQVGSRNIDNLYDFIAEHTRMLGHINGDGHCGE